MNKRLVFSLTLTIGCLFGNEAHAGTFWGETAYQYIGTGYSFTQLANDDSNSDGYYASFYASLAEYYASFRDTGYDYVGSATWYLAYLCAEYAFQYSLDNFYSQFLEGVFDVNAFSALEYLYSGYQTAYLVYTSD